jgi:hypothetical protein
MTFYWKFIDTLVKNIATISAIVVGVFQFLIKSFNENDGTSKVRKFINQTLFVVNRFTAFVYEVVNANVLPPVNTEAVKVTKNRKRVAA